MIEPIFRFLVCCSATATFVSLSLNVCDTVLLSFCEAESHVHSLDRYCPILGVLQWARVCSALKTTYGALLRGRSLCKSICGSPTGHLHDDTYCSIISISKRATRRAVYKSRRNISYCIVSLDKKILK